METIQVNGAIITDKVAETIAKLQEPGESIMTVYLRTLEELLDEKLMGDKKKKKDWEHAGHLRMLQKDLEAIRNVTTSI